MHDGGATCALCTLEEANELTSYTKLLPTRRFTMRSFSTAASGTSVFSPPWAAPWARFVGARRRSRRRSRRREAAKVYEVVRY